MYYIIREGSICETDREIWENSPESIAVFEEEEWGAEIGLREKYSMEKNQNPIFFCKMERYASCLFGTFHIPVKKKERRHRNFAVYILEDRLIFIDDDGFVEEIAEKLTKLTRKKTYTIENYFNDVIMSLLTEDVLYLASLEREIADMEEMVLQGDTRYFNHQMLGIKKEISRLYCYYSQMTDVGEVLCEEKKGCRMFAGRVRRLQQEALTLREYAMQVQDVYQSEIGIRQNDIMKVLTIVTTIFLPLTLIAGWYGMNFYNMPELVWKYGYPAVSAISLLIVVVSLWFFKKKKFF